MIVGVLVTLSLVAAAQGTKPAPSNTPVPSCVSRVKAAQTTGYKAGFDDGTKEAQIQCAKEASVPKWSQESYEAGTHANDTDLKASAGKIPIQILIEKIPNADEYRLAAVEVITTYFSQHYSIVGISNLTLYIGGTNEMHGVVSYTIVLQIYTSSGVKIGERTVPVSGFLNLEEDGGTMMNYSPEERTKVIKAKIYSILSKGDAVLFPQSK